MTELNSATEFSVISSEASVEKPETSGENTSTIPATTKNLLIMFESFLSE
jgi:hypothetical protein